MRSHTGDAAHDVVRRVDRLGFEAQAAGLLHRQRLEMMHRVHIVEEPHVGKHRVAVCSSQHTGKLSAHAPRARAGRVRRARSAPAAVSPASARDGGVCARACRTRVCVLSNRPGLSPYSLFGYRRRTNLQVRDPSRTGDTILQGGRCYTIFVRKKCWTPEQFSLAFTPALTPLRHR